jgi:hypothetical protein
MSRRWNFFRGFRVREATLRDRSGTKTKRSVKAAKTAKELEQNIKDVFIDIALGFGFKITSGRLTTTPDDSATGPKKKYKIDREETTIRDEIGEDVEDETDIDPEVPTPLPEPIPEFIDQVNKYLYIEQYSIPTAGGQPRLVKRQRYEIVFDIKVPQTVIIKSGTTGELMYNGSVLNDTAKSSVAIGADQIWNVSRFNEPFIRMGDVPTGDRFTARGLPSVREFAS